LLIFRPSFWLFSQEEFAARAGYSRSYVSQVENGHYSASLDAIIAFANVLKVVPAGPT